MKPQATLTKITPKQAAEWLLPEVNSGNRAMREDHTVFLACEMEAGRWQITHQGIAFDKHGRLLDGQHRLAAIVLYEKPVEMMVTTGLDPEAFSAMDGGLKRANHDRISLVPEYPQNHIICLAIRAFLSETFTKRGGISVGEIQEQFEKRKAAWSWIGREGVGMTPRLKKAAIMAALGVYRYVNADKAAVFMDGYRSGVGLTQESPLLKLRNMALLGSSGDCSYWRVVSVLRAHLKGKTISSVYPAAEDMIGNENSAKVVEERSAKSKKAAETRKKRQGDSDGARVPA